MQCKDELALGVPGLESAPDDASQAVALIIANGTASGLTAVGSVAVWHSDLGSPSSLANSFERLGAVLFAAGQGPWREQALHAVVGLACCLGGLIGCTPGTAIFSTAVVMPYEALPAELRRETCLLGVAVPLNTHNFVEKNFREEDQDWAYQQYFWEGATTVSAGQEVSGQMSTGRVGLLPLPQPRARSSTFPVFSDCLSRTGQFWCTVDTADGLKATVPCRYRQFPFRAESTEPPPALLIDYQSFACTSRRRGQDRRCPKGGWLVRIDAVRLGVSPVAPGEYLPPYVSEPPPPLPEETSEPAYPFRQVLQQGRDTKVGSLTLWLESVGLEHGLDDHTESNARLMVRNGERTRTLSLTRSHAQDLRYIPVFDRELALEFSQSYQEPYEAVVWIR